VILEVVGGVLQSTRFLNRMAEPLADAA
jgi:hypothetical protein